ncbi:fusaricidin synthetase, partial [Bacillus clarus]
MKTKTTELLPLTQAQNRIWYTELLYPNTNACILSGTVKIQKQIDIDVLQQAFQSVIKENDAFRIKLTLENGEAKQYVEPYTYRKINFVDFSENSTRDDVENWLDSHDRIPMKLYDSELYEITMFKIHDEEYGYNIKIHHIICDGISLAQIVEDVNQNYADMVKGTFLDTYKKHSYLDYMQAEEEYEKSARFQKDKAFWLEKFQSLPDFTELKPYNPLLASTAAERKVLEISVDFYHKVRAFCKENKISIFTFFLGALYMYINKVTNEKDLIIGTNYANRTTRQEKETVGMFTSTVAVKVSLDPEDDIISFLQQVSKEQIKILRHQKYPYNQLIKDVRQIHSMPDLGRLFSIAMEYRPFRNMVDMDGTKMDMKSTFCGNEVNDLLIHVVERIDEGYLEIYADYRTCLFDEKYIDALFRHVFVIAEHIMNHPFEKIA